MLFTSLAFVVLLTTTVLLYYLPVFRGLQVLVLIVASFTFYAYAEPWLLSILILSCSINAVSSFGIFRAATWPVRRAWAILGVAVNLGLLLFFKYSRLIFTSLGGHTDQLQGIGHFLLTIPLPIGISFFTFQGISLVIDTFRWKRSDAPPPYEPTSFWQHFYYTTFFKSFFPQLIAGPIVKARQFLPQISRKALSTVRWDVAFRYLVTGYFLKMVVADNLKDQTFWIAAPYFLVFSSVELATMLFGYSMQIFADFAGYSLIALGLAELFGYHLPANFDFPYISATFAEFWTRWHISLSTWLREYLYIPLGGNRKGPVRTYINLFVVMFLGGLWHGAAWSYAIWGAFHGLALAVERWVEGPGPRVVRAWPVEALRMMFVFTLVTLAWLLFKLPHFEDVFAYLKAFVSNGAFAVNTVLVLLIAVYSIPVIVYHAIHLLRRRFTGPWLVRAEPAVYGAMLFLIASNSGSSGDFIYFQF